MKIGVTLYPYGDKIPGGLGKSIFKIVESLVETNPGIEFEIYLKDGNVVLPKFKTNNYKFIVLNTKYLYFYFGSKISSQLDAQIFLTPAIPIFLWPKKSIVVLFDFAYLQNAAPGFRNIVNRLVIKYLQYLSIIKAKQLVSISSDAASDAEKFLGIDKNKIKPVHIGFIPQSTTVVKSTTYGNYFLFAGVLKSRKNVLNQILGFQAFIKKTGNTDYRFLIVGKKEGVYYKDLQEKVLELGLEKRVLFLGYVPDGELSVLYSNAKALVFVSSHEGFGMPILEAFSLGVSVITSNRGAMKEVAGNCAFLANPESPDSIAEEMLKVVSDIPEVRIKKQEAIVWSKEFSWVKFTDALVNIIKTW